MKRALAQAGRIRGFTNPDAQAKFDDFKAKLRAAHAAISPDFDRAALPPDVVAVKRAAA